MVVQTGPVPFDILGLPELGLPIGFTPAGVPIGTILGGQPYAEDQLLAVAAAYQALTDWHLRRPPDPPGEAPPPTAVDADPDRPPFPRRPSGRRPATGADAGRGRIEADEVPHVMQ